MPAPQPGWAAAIRCEHASDVGRKFEPAAITGGESQGVMQTLLLLYRRNGDKKYLEPLPRALDYYRDSLLPDGRLARFYELKTNKPSISPASMCSPMTTETCHALRVQGQLES